MGSIDRCRKLITAVSIGSILNRSLVYIISCLVILAASPSFGATEGTTFLDAYTSLEYDDNLSAAELSDDTHSDFSLLGGLSYAYGRELSDTDGFLIRGAAEVRRFARFHALSSMTLKTSLDYRWHLSNELFAPWFRGAIHAGYTKTHRSEIRDGWRYSLEPTIGMRLTHRIEAHLGYIYDHRNSSQGRSFDLIGHRVHAGLRYDLTSSTVLYVKGFQRHGQSASSGVTGTPDIKALRRVVEADPAFGPGNKSWRVTSVTRSIELGTDLRIDDENIVNIGGFYAITEGKGSIRWNKYGLFVLYSHSFF